MWGIRRALFESRSEARCVRLARSSCAVATSRQAAQGHPVNTGRDSRGGLLLVTFLARPREGTKRRPPRRRAPFSRGAPVLPDSTRRLWNSTWRGAHNAPHCGTRTGPRRKPLVESSCSARRKGGATTSNSTATATATATDNRLRLRIEVLTC